MSKQNKELKEFQKNFADEKKRKLPSSKKTKNTSNCRNDNNKRKRTNLDMATQPIVSNTERVWERSGTEPSNVVQETNTTEAPTWTLSGAEIDHDYARCTTKTENPELVTSLTKEKLQEISDYMQIYTDGSITDLGTGCAFVIPQMNHVKRFSLNYGISIFTVELFAILQALTFVNKMDIPPEKAAIISDSKSALQVLAKKQTKNRSEMVNEILTLTNNLRQKGTHVKLLWTPSHCGIKGNEMADSEAKKAAEEAPQKTKEGHSTNIKLSLRELKTKITAAVIDDWCIDLNDIIMSPEKRK